MGIRKLRLLVTIAVAAVVLIPVAVLAAGGFEDVSDDNVFKADIEWLADAGVTKGCNPPANTKYCPKGSVTREQMAAFMHRLAVNRVVDAGTVEGKTATDLKGQKGDTGPRGDKGDPGDPGVSMVPPSSGCAGIQAALDSLGAENGTVRLDAGLYVCTEPIVIDRDRVTLQGVGPSTIIKLADGANSPVLVIGDDSPTPAKTVRHVRVVDLFIDANREHQTVECDPDCATNPLRNNGVTIRRSEDVTVENVTVRGGRSGGIVTELESRRIRVNSVRLIDNHLDGLAGYETEDSMFTGLIVSANAAAGLSLDRGFNNNVLADIVITDSGTSGIFLRDGSYNIFDGIRIVRSGENGAFLAQLTAAEDPDTPAPTGNTFSSMTITDSADWGFFQADAAVTDTLLDSAQFINNESGCHKHQPGGPIREGDIVCHP
jgi:hypothetical protein